MQEIIELITLKCSQFDSNSRSTGGPPPSLDKLAILANLNRIDIHYLFAIYLHDKRSIAMLRAHLAAKFKLPNKHMDYQLNVVNGALFACSTNAYKSVSCYKCKGTGSDCKRCAGIGVTSKKPKVHEICDVPRNSWYSKNIAPVREMYETILDYLFKIDAQIQEVTNKNKQLTD